MSGQARSCRYNAGHDQPLVTEWSAAEKANLDISPQTGEEVQAFVETLYASPPDVIARARKVLGR